MDESHYRHLVDEVFRRIDSAFETIDPDLAESEYSQGTLVVTIREKLKLILSPQAPTRQIWMAFRDRAWHFSYDADKQTWLDDRGQGHEPEELVQSLVAENTGVQLRLSS